ncbi:MAG: hypothetical protein HC914_02200 [Chloroflexaceae bacterium]|nr:hypothetical protein [Chloroflexaceae bacterium]
MNRQVAVHAGKPLLLILIALMSVGTGAFLAMRAFTPRHQAQVVEGMVWGEPMGVLALPEAMQAELEGKQAAGPADAGSTAGAASLTPQELEEAQEGNVAERISWYYEQRAYPRDEFPIDAVQQAVEHMQQMPSDTGLAAAEPWEELGPAPIDEGSLGYFIDNNGGLGIWRDNVSGRVKAIEFDPTNPNTVYVATATGGMWKSTDGGQSYTSLMDNVPELAIHAMAIDPTNSQIVYAGTGELATSTVMVC